MKDHASTGSPGSSAGPMRSEARLFRALIAAVSVCMLFWTGGSGTARAAEAAAESSEGANLAAELRSSAPAESMTLSGRISIRDAASNVRDLPFQFRTTVTQTNWATIYRVSRETTPPLPLLAVIHEEGKPNTYWEADPSDPDHWKPLESKAVPKAFAGSDFSILDLGLEFFHWGGQRVIKSEMRKSRSCRVLESTNPNPGSNECSRVVSWVDVESGGLLVAEAYDAQNKLLKEFSVNSMKKVNDRWQVQQMEIRNVQTKSRTRLDFQIK